MAEVWLLIEVKDSILKDKPLGDGVRVRYLVSPRLKLTREERSADEVVGASSDKGFEVRYCSSVSLPVAPWIWRKIEENVLAELRNSLGRNVRSFAVSIEPLARMARYSA
jgi:hypothetical protein